MIAAIAFVIVALVAALAYALPKIFWIRWQIVLIREQGKAEQSRFDSLKNSHDKTMDKAVLLSPSEIPTDGPYL